MDELGGSFCCLEVIASYGDVVGKCEDVHTRQGFYASEEVVDVEVEEDRTEDSALRSALVSLHFSLAHHQESVLEGCCYSYDEVFRDIHQLQFSDQSAAVHFVEGLLQVKE